MNKMIIASVIALAIPLAACGEKPAQIITSQELKIAVPPESLYDCPVLKVFPNPDKLTDRQVAAVINTLVINNKKCYNSLMAIKSWSTRVQTSVDPLNKASNKKK